VTQEQVTMSHAGRSSGRAFWTALAALVVAIASDAITLPAAGRQTTSAQSTPILSQPAKSPQRELLDRYCITCHNDKARVGNLALDVVDEAKIADHPEIWEKVAYKVRAGMMPQFGRPRPDQPTLDAFVAYLTTALDAASLARPNPGRTETFHRLNRPEYQNAVRDVLALDIDIRSLLPPDDTHANGFGNMADVLTVSPSLLDRYMSAARQISRLAVGIPPGLPEMKTYRANVLLDQTEWLGDAFSLGSRGGLAARHYFPVDGEYSARIKLQRNYVDYIRGLGEPQDIELRLDGALVKRFTVGGKGLGGFGLFPGPTSHGGDINGDAEWTSYMFNADDGLEVRFSAKAGSRGVAVSFRQKRVELEGVRPSQPRAVGAALTYDEMSDGYAAIDQVVIGGPYQVTGPGDTLSRRRIFVCRPTGASDQDRCAKSILSTLARRAYRRPITDEDVQTLFGFFTAERDNGFDKAIELSLERILTDPEFLFRVERDPANAAPGSIYRISDLELASRLSFFLWSSIPDDELLDLATRGRLKAAGVLKKQVQRMLADVRSKALVDNFVGEWLEFRNIQNVAPDQNVFPDFDENLRHAFEQETELFVGSQIREDHSVVDLLTADYTFVNERLAKHYGIPNVAGDRFRRVHISDPARAGILGQGSILAVTSYPNRTSPVLRGKFLLSNILGTPPSPPPPVVPGFPDRGEGGKPASVRARLEQHRKNPTCAACHQPMDPLGFALENFDGIGGWRTEDTGARIDASGKLPNGGEFDGPAGLRALLVSHREQFVGTVTEKLLAYALGRAVEYYDLPVARKIARDAATDDYRWSSIVLNIVESVPFQMRKAR
jgi:mono/diheme cytochrome c family protein